MRRSVLRWSAGFAIAAGLAMPSLATATAAHASTSATCPAGEPTGAAPGQTTPNSPGRPSTYPLGQCQLLLSSGVIPAGGTVVVTGSGFASYTKVALSMSPYGTALGTATTGSTGGFTSSVAIPASTPPGTYAILASGGGQSETAVLQVTTPASTASQRSTGGQSSGGQTLSAASGTGSSGPSASGGSATSTTTSPPAAGGAGSATTGPGTSGGTGGITPTPASIARPGGSSPLAWILAGIGALIVAAGAALILRRRGASAG